MGGPRSSLLKDGARPKQGLKLCTLRRGRFRRYRTGCQCAGEKGIEAVGTHGGAVPG